VQSGEGWAVMDRRGRIELCADRAFVARQLQASYEAHPHGKYIVRME
jgi:hypothetical protein